MKGEPMNKDMNKKMEFIVEHQTKFAAEIEIMREVQAADAKFFREQDRKLSDAFIGLMDVVGSLTRAQPSADVRINSLAGDFSVLAKVQAGTDESLKRLSEAQARTEESLKSLINTVERHVGGNDGSHSHA
jgi:hypothetical protein